ncbi:MAG: caspase family protein, partial [Pseudomonadota bacterium]
ATPGAHGVLRWHVNRGWDEAPEAIPVHEIAETNRPAVISRVVQEGGTGEAIAAAELEKIRLAVELRTGVETGRQLHLLTIGVSDYGSGADRLRLDFADDDALAVKNALLNDQRSLYERVVPQHLTDDDATESNVRGALADMAELMAAAGDAARGDLAVVLFSGHGAVLDGEYHLILHGVSDRSEAHLAAAALPASTLRNALSNLPGRVLLLIDACRADAATGAGDIQHDADRLREALRAPNVAVLTSSTAKQASYESESWGDGGAGAFTAVFLDALRHGDSNRNGLISMDELMRYLQTHVPLLTSGRQVPQVDVRFGGELFVTKL